MRVPGEAGWDYFGGDILDHHLTTLAGALDSFREAGAQLERWGRELAWTVGRGGRLLVAGNGGSSAEAQHLTAELVGKLRDDRPALSAIALCADVAALTAVTNDYGYEELFARSVRAHGRPADILLLMTTSGRSPNLLAAARAAADIGVRCWAFTGPAPNPLADICPETLAIGCEDRQVVQELHLVAVHVLCEYVDLELPAVLGLAAGEAGGLSATVAGCAQGQVGG